MKIKLSQLKQIIREELSSSLNLNEAKQVGDLYHYTQVYPASLIIDHNRINPSTLGNVHKNHAGLKAYRKLGQNMPYVSFTRTPYRTFDHIEESPVALVVDGNKLSEKYKIIPYQDPYVYSPFIISPVIAKDDTERNRQGIEKLRTDPKYDEQEERIYSRDGIPYILRYLKKILLYVDDQKAYDMLSNALKKSKYPNIPIEIVNGTTQIDPHDPLITVDDKVDLARYKLNKSNNEN